MPVTRPKAKGAHFTPPDVARLVAEGVAALVRDLKGPVRVLDPACGDGNLLCAINEALPREMRRRVTLIGIENDDVSFASALRENLRCSARTAPSQLAARFGLSGRVDHYQAFLVAITRQLPGESEH